MPPAPVMPVPGRRRWLLARSMLVALTVVLPPWLYEPGAVEGQRADRMRGIADLQTVWRRRD